MRRADHRPQGTDRTSRRARTAWPLRALVLGVALLVPITISAALGLLWLVERGLLLGFALSSLALVALTLGLGWLVGMAMRKRSGASASRPDGAQPSAGVDPDPGWSAHETAAFAAARARIAERLVEPVAWDALPEMAFEVVESVATDLSQGSGSALDFTLPEALLLIDRVALRYRTFLRRHVPLIDQISVRTLWWMWTHRHPARRIWQSGGMIWRGTRLVLNPAWGVLREIERLMTAGLTDRLSVEAMHEAQIILLEEVAHAAVELHSGRLRTAASDLPADRAASGTGTLPPLTPLRLVLAGQTGAGRSALLNALAQATLAETDMAPVGTSTVAALEVIDGQQVALIEPPGLDGTPARLEAQLADLRRADLIVWVVRANRPARAEDRALRRAHAEWMASDPRRRAPPQVVVATGADLLLPGWPFAEHALPGAAQTRLGAAMAAIAADLDAPGVIPVRAIEPDWNIDTLRTEISSHLDEAIMVQHNRCRLEAEAGQRPLRDNLDRLTRGLQGSARIMARRLRR